MLNNKNKKYQLDIYCTFLSCFYISTFQDILNVVYSSPRHRCLFEKFHFNPISIDINERKYFPNIKVLHLYNKNEIGRAHV